MRYDLKFAFPLAAVLAAILLPTAMTLGGVNATTIHDHQSLKVGDEQREYRLVVPDGIGRDKPAPLIFAFHGMGIDSPEFMAKYSHLDDLAAKEGFLLCYPAAAGKSWGMTPAKAMADIAFFDALLNKLSADFKVDPKWVYVLGMSNGAYFANVVAQARPMKIAAICSHSGSLGVFAVRRGLEEKHKYPVLIVHGTDDHLLSIDLARKTKEAYENAGYPVQMIEVPGLGHEWATRIDVNDKIWDFFKSNPMP